MRLCAVALAAVSWASSSPAQQDSGGRPEEWRSRLLGIGDRLLAEEWVQAEKQAVALASEMAEQIVGGSGVDMMFGMVTTYRALALSGQQRHDEAIWYWQVAQQLFPQVKELDLSRFGPWAGALQLHAPRQPGIKSDLSDQGGEFVAPRRLSSPTPRFSSGRAFRGLEVDVVLQVIVGVDGRPSQPLILESRGEPTLVWAALEALREWTFEPASRDGVPEPVLYKLTVSFVVPDV